jgi:Cytochrome P460
MKFASVVAALLLMCAAGFASEVQAARPSANKNELLLPADYHKWVSISPSTPGMPTHHHKHVANKLYVEPAAFAHFTKTGKWPDNTVIVLELISGPATRSEVRGLEAAVKDDKHFPEPWSYYGIVFDRPPAKRAPMKAEKMCDCEQPLDSMLAMAFPTLRAVINAKPWSMSPTVF